MGEEEEGRGGNSSLINWWDLHNNNNNSTPPSSSPDNNHLNWTHVFLGVGSNKEKLMYEEEAACNYLKQLDTTWDHQYNNNNNNSSPSINSTSFDHHHHHGLSDEASIMFQSDNDQIRLSKQVNTWSIAPPHHHQTNIIYNNSHFDHDVTLSSCMDDNSGVFSSYSSDLEQDMKLKQQYPHPPHTSLSEGLLGYHNNNNNNNISSHHSDDHDQYGMIMPTRNLSDVISFTTAGGRIGRPIIGIHHHTLNKPSFRPPSSDQSKKHLFQKSSRTNNGRGRGSSATSSTSSEVAVKKKRSDDYSPSQPNLKKPKQHTTSTPSSNTTNVQAPKVKLGDRITTLQQIVSPFGKTDTASVLFEAIGYIKFLQEQVQLLSNSYMKTNSHRETTWGSMEIRKEETKGDLRSRGLCLVPISWTPQSYRDNSAPDYWTPAYRGCLFR